MAMAEERYLSSLRVVREPQAACFNPGHSPLVQTLNTVFFLPQTPLSYGSFNDLCCTKAANTDGFSSHHTSLFDYLLSF